MNKIGMPPAGSNETKDGIDFLGITIAVLGIAFIFYIV